MRRDLVVGVGGIKGFAIACVQDHGLGLVHQRGFIGNFQVFRSGQFGHLLVGCRMILDHHVGKLLDLFRLRLLQRLARGFDFRNALGGGFLKEIIRVDGVVVGVHSRHAAIHVVIANRTRGIGAATITSGSGRAGRA